MVNDSADVTSSMSAGRRPEKFGYQQSTVCAGRHYQAIGADRTQRSSTVGRSATRVKGPTLVTTLVTLHFLTVLNSVFSETKKTGKTGSRFQKNSVLINITKYQNQTNFVENKIFSRPY